MLDGQNVVQRTRTVGTEAGCTDCQDSKRRKDVVVPVGSIVASPREVLGVCTSCNSLLLGGDPMQGDVPGFIARKLDVPGCDRVTITINAEGVERGFVQYRGTHTK